MLEPTNHFPECQHFLKSHPCSRGRIFNTGTRLPANPTADAARLAPPHNKINPVAVQCAVAHKANTPPISTVA